MSANKVHSPYLRRDRKLKEQVVDQLHVIHDPSTMTVTNDALLNTLANLFRIFGIPIPFNFCVT
jgi:hypothetical protein